MAISIWSHYAAGAAARWLDEMARLIAPGGRLVLTFHGLHSLAHFSRERLRSPELLAQAARSLYERGSFFHDEFGPAGDAGVRHPEWGLSFFSVEWLLATTRDAWAASAHLPGAADGNQDVVVLARR